MHFEICKKTTSPRLEFSIFDDVHRSRQVVLERVQKLILYQFVVLQGTLIRESFSENGQSTYAEMHFEICKKKTYPIISLFLFSVSSHVEAISKVKNKCRFFSKLLGNDLQSAYRWLEPIITSRNVSIITNEPHEHRFFLKSLWFSKN